MGLGLGPPQLDELSLILLSLSLVIYLYYRWNVFSPDIHNSFLTCQANLSPTRLPAETPIYRHRAVPFSSSLVYRISRDNDTVNSLITKALEANGDRELIGYWQLGSGTVNVPIWLRGKDVLRTVLRFGNGLYAMLFVKEEGYNLASGNCFNRRKGASSSVEGGPVNVVAVVEETHADLVIAMLAGALFNFTIDLLAPKLLESAHSLAKFFTRFEAQIGSHLPIVILTPHSKLCRVLEGLDLSGLGPRATVVLLDPPPVGFINPSLNSGARVVIFKDVGAGMGGQHTLPTHPAGNGDVLYRIWREADFTEFLDSHVLAAVAAIASSFPVQFPITDMDVYFSPRSVVATSEWATVLFMLHKGCQVAIPTEGQTGNLRAVFKPTVTFFSAPEVLDVVQSWGLGIGEEAIGGELVGTATPLPPPMGVVKRYTLQSHLKILKLHRHLQTGGWWDRWVFRRERSHFGGRLRLAYTVNPFLPLALQNALRVVLGIQIISTLPLSPFSAQSRCASYGWVAVATFFDYNSDPKLPRVGAPAPSVEAKVVMDRPTETLKEDPIGELEVRGTSLLSQDAWLATGLICRVDATCSLAVLGQINDPLAGAAQKAGLRWVETWIAAHDPYVHCLRLHPTEFQPLRLGGHIVLRSDAVMRFAKNRNLTQDLPQLINSARLKAQVLQGIQADLTAAACPARAPPEGLCPGIPGPIPSLELDAAGFTLSLADATLPSAPDWDPEWWE